MTGTAHTMELDMIASDFERHLMARDPTDPKYAHEAWLIEQSIKGWKWGVDYNLEKKTNPRFLPYDHLPENLK